MLKIFEIFVSFFSFSLRNVESRDLRRIIPSELLYSGVLQCNAAQRGCSVKLGKDHFLGLGLESATLYLSC